MAESPRNCPTCSKPGRSTLRAGDRAQMICPERHTWWVGAAGPAGGRIGGPVANQLGGRMPRPTAKPK